MSEPRTNGKEEEKQPPGSEKIAQIHNHSTNGVININSNITIHNFFHNIFHHSESHSATDHPQSYQSPTAEPPLSSGTQSNSDPAPSTPVPPISQSPRANTTQSVGSTSIGSLGLPPRTPPLVNIVLRDSSGSTARESNPEPPPYMHPSTSLRDRSAQGAPPILSEESRARVDAVWNLHRGPFEEMMGDMHTRMLGGLTDQQYLDRIFARLGHPPKTPAPFKGA